MGGKYKPADIVQMNRKRWPEVSAKSKIIGRNFKLSACEEQETLMHAFRYSTLLVLGFILVGAHSAADDIDRGHVLSPDGTPGTIILAGGRSIPAAVADILKEEVAGGSVVVLAHAAEDRDQAVSSSEQWLHQLGISSVVVAPYSGDRDAFQSQTLGAIRQAQGVWIIGGQQTRLAEAFSGCAIESELQQLLARGGIVGGTSAGAAILSKVMIASGMTEPDISVGWDVVADCIIDQHFTERQRESRLKLAVQKTPCVFGLGVDEDTAAVIRGRQMRVVGRGAVSVVFRATALREGLVSRIESGDVADVTQLRRAALSRSTERVEQFAEPVIPRVEQGSLVIVGGGGLPDEIVHRFVNLAGGRKARIVVLPTAVSRDETSVEIPGFFKGADVERVTVLPQRGLEISSDEFQSAMKEATAVWFGGGRQWHFVDAYEGTGAVELFRDVLRRGGVIGGSSAGATIQGEFLVRGHPLGNTVMMAEGYEQGFAFFPGTAIDQHFSQRRRQPDLIPVIQRYPGLLGIGIDESTAIVVSGCNVEVVGDHAAHFLTTRSAALPQAADQADSRDLSLTPNHYRTVQSGERLDLSDLFGSK
ncbi:MAG: cyanophycinase [Planctomycetota bacterium]